MADYKTTVKPETTVVKATVKKTTDPCEKCTREFDKKSPFCTSCVNYKDK